MKRNIYSYTLTTSNVTWAEFCSFFSSKEAGLQNTGCMLID